MNQEKAIALVEFGGSHEECLYAQILFLRSRGYKIHLLISEVIGSRVHDFDVDYLVSINTSSWSWIRMFNAARYITNHSIETVVLNTASGNLVRVFVFLVSRKVNLIGIVHNAKKLIKSSSQRWISRYVKKYFVLNDYIISNIPEKQDIVIRSIYFIFFPSFVFVDVFKPSNELWIGIPGGLEVERRDYYTLIANLIQHPPPAHIKFILLGRTNKNAPNVRKIINLLQQHNLMNYFLLFEDFVDNNRFYSYIKLCDLIMPLLHISNPLYTQYGYTKISGTFNLAIAFRKALLMDNPWSTYDDFKDVAFFYDENNILSEIECIEQIKIKQKEAAYADNRKFRFEYQADNYFKLINNT